MVALRRFKSLGIILSELFNFYFVVTTIYVVFFLFILSYTDNYKSRHGILYLHNSAPPVAENLCNPSGGLETLGRTNDEWIIISTANNSAVVAIYSAYFDDRLTIQPGEETNDTFNYIRISVLIKFHASRDYMPIFCFLFTNKSSDPFHVEEGMLNMTGRLGGITDAKIIPNSVSLAFSNCSKSHLLVGVRLPARQVMRQVSICVPISFGTIDESSFIEWVEFYRNLGVSDINIYDAGMTNMSRVFGYYRRLGILHVYPLRPILADSGLGAVKLNSAISLNDCMMRHIYDTEYILAIDFDEFVLPRKHRNFRQLVDSLETDFKKQLNRNKQKSNLQRAAVVFKNASLKTPAYKWDKFSFYFGNILFFLDHPKHRILKGELIITSYPYAYTDPNRMSGAKSLVNPRQCFIVYNHFCLQDLKPGAGNWLIFVKDEIGANLHFRKCNLGKQKCDDIFYNNTNVKKMSHHVGKEFSEIVKAAKIIINTYHFD